jgi:polyphosphate kinase
MWYLQDNTQAWGLQEDGFYAQVDPGASEPFAVQQHLLDQLSKHKA